MQCYIVTRKLGKRAYIEGVFKTCAAAFKIILPSLEGAEIKILRKGDKLQIFKKYEGELMWRKSISAVHISELF